MRHSTIHAAAPLRPRTVAVAPAGDPRRRAGARRGAPHRRLPALADGRSPAMRAVRVVVADGGSRDATRADRGRARGRVPEPRAHRQPRPPAVGRARTGSSRTCARPEHRVLVRCDAHAVYPPGYVLRVADEPRRPRRRGARRRRWTPSAPAASSARRPGSSTRRSAPAARAHRGGRRSGCVDHGHHAGIRLDWFRRVGGYDPGFSHNEDAELDHRLAQAGGRIWLDARIRIAYAMRADLGGARAAVLALRPRPGADACSSTGCGRGLRQPIPVLTARRRWRPASRLRSLHPAFLLGPAGYLALLAGASLWTAARRARPAASGPDRRSRRCTCPGARASSGSWRRDQSAAERMSSFTDCRSVRRPSRSRARSSSRPISRSARRRRPEGRAALRDLPPGRRAAGRAAPRAAARRRASAATRAAAASSRSSSISPTEPTNCAQ